MKKTPFFLSATRALAMTGLLATLSLPAAAAAAALFNLEGTALDARLPSDAGMRMSVLGWTADDQAAALVEEYRKYADSQDHAAFQTFLQQQETKGYLFTKAATGYTIKYAWQDPAAEEEDSQRMVLLVTPALKTRNPYMWKTANGAPAPFSVVELRFDGDEATVKTSLEAEVEVAADGHLQLQDFAGATSFATVRDATPYYLKK
jgi:hypothetical protein